MAPNTLPRDWLGLVLGSLVLAACSASSSSDTEATSTTLDVQPSTTTTVHTTPRSPEALVEATGGDDAIVILAVNDRTHTVAAARGSTEYGAVEASDAFPAMSISKMIVATAILQLVDEGLVDLDDPLSSYVGGSIPDEVTVRHTLQHRSGIPNIYKQLTACPTETTLTTALTAGSTSAGPTADSQYSNTNYLILGQLLTAVSGVDAGTLTAERIFGPSAMIDTYWWESGPAPSGATPALVGRQVINPDSCPRLETTVGFEGLTFVTTAPDLDRFFRALFAGDLISDAALAEMVPSPGDEVGLGLWTDTRDDDAVTMYGHFGGRDDMVAVAYYDPKAKRSVVGFASEDVDLESLLREAWDWMKATQE